MLLGVSELPCQGKTDLAQWHFYGHVLYVVRTHGLLLDVELIAGVALKNTKKAGVLTGIKILPKSTS